MAEVLVFPKAYGSWIDSVEWLIYLASYAGYPMVRGAFEGWYLCFLLNATNLGYAKVTLNSVFP